MSPERLHSVALRHETHEELQSLGRSIGATMKDTLQALLMLATELGSTEDGSFDLPARIREIKLDRLEKKRRRRRGNML